MLPSAHSALGNCSVESDEASHLAALLGCSRWCVYALPSCTFRFALQLSGCFCCRCCMGCRAHLGGGGINTPQVSKDFTLKIMNSKISDHSTHKGGGIHAQGGKVALGPNVEITRNTATDDGGGLLFIGVNATMQQSVRITGNTAGSTGNSWELGASECLWQLAKWHMANSTWHCCSALLPTASGFCSSPCPSCCLLLGARCTKADPCWHSCLTYCFCLYGPTQAPIMTAASADLDGLVAACVVPLLSASVTCFSCGFNFA